MDLDQVTTFLTLADELHFGRTAERLHVAQSRVSRLIAALERQVGGQLFERRPAAAPRAAVQPGRLRADERPDAGRLCRRVLRLLRARLPRRVRRPPGRRGGHRPAGSFRDWALAHAGAFK
ncbi:MAG TPA: LysR family transcriptional regulator [Streptosporangiaceae bacterium]